jgi:hypothetical protein
MITDLNSFDYMAAQYNEKPPTGASMKSGVTDAIDF